MFNKNDMVRYKGDDCKIIDIKNNSFSNKMCYMLVPLYDESLTISVPTDNDGYIKSILSKKEVLDLIKKIPKIEVIDVDSKLIENESVKIISDEDYNKYKQLFDKFEKGFNIIENVKKWFIKIFNLIKKMFIKT